MKKIKVIVEDSNTLILAEDGEKGDKIDLREVARFDSSMILKAIENGKDEVYLSKLDEVKHNLELEYAKHLSSKSKEFDTKLHQMNDLHSQEKTQFEKLVMQKDASYKENIAKLEAAHQVEVLKSKNEIIQKYQEELSVLKNTIANAVKDKANEIERIRNESIANENLLKEKLKQNDEAIALLLKNKELEIASKHALDIKDIENKNTLEIEKLKNNFALKEAKDKAEFSNLLNEQLKEKDDEISDLKRERASRNIKLIGENLESYCNNVMLEAMQNGFSNCSWSKDNETIISEGEQKGTKADFIFRIFADDSHQLELLLSSLCLEMKSEDMNSQNRKTNAYYYKALDNNRRKKKCEYAILVSELEMDKPNYLPIYKVLEYPNMYVVRPSYMITFINMIVSLTMRFQILMLEAEKAKVEFRDREDILADFASIKESYLDKQLDVLKKNIMDILACKEAIDKQTIKIEEACSTITNKYINNITSKLETFTIKLNRDLKKIDKQE